MQAVILAAGRGTRMEELTHSVPKPMLDVEGKPLLEYKFEALPDEVNEVIIIVGHLGGVIQRHFGSSYINKKILYVEQKELNGTAGALWCAKDVLKDRFLVMMGDDIYAKSDIEACIAEGNVWRLLVQQVPEMRRAGDVELDEDVNIAAIVEGDRGTTPGLASTNMFLLDTRLFSCPLVPKQADSLEYGLPQTVLAGAKKLGIRFEPVFTDKWIQITSPKDLVKAADMLKKKDV
ncbi:MAG: nucleotidyltransferase family protein [bacterium]|nr:nucleotidyltransferase family protein [bacterium]